MLRYINLERENMKHWKLGVIAALMSGAVYAAPMNEDETETPDAAELTP